MGLGAQDTYGFGEDRAAKYDQDIVRALPGYQGLHEAQAQVLGPSLPEKARILVVGAGTGADLPPLAALPRCAEILACEPEPAMAAFGRQKCGTRLHDTNIAWHVGPLAEVAPECFDAVVMTLVLHFVADDGGKATLWREVAERLAPRGKVAFVNLTLPERPEDVPTHLRAWEEFNRANGVPEEEYRGFFDERVHALHMVTPDREEALWREAGLRACATFRHELFLRGILLEKID